MKVGQVLQDARALLSSQLSVKKARVVTWSAAPLSEQIRTGEHLLKESPAFCGSPDSMCRTLSRDALRRTRPASVMVASRKGERGAVDDARAQGRGQGNCHWERAMSAIPSTTRSRASQLGFGGSGKDNKPRARSAMASVGSAPVASCDIDVDQRLDASMSEDGDGGGTIPSLYDPRGQGKHAKSVRPSIGIKDTVWGSLSSFSGLEAGRVDTPSPLWVPESEGEITRPATSQSDRRSACSSASVTPLTCASTAASLSNPSGPSLLDSEALAADAFASPGLKTREMPALDRLHEGALIAGVWPCSCIP